MRQPSANNLASFNGISISVPGNGIPAPVYDILQWNGTLVAASKLKKGNDTLGVMKLVQENWVSLPGIGESVWSDSTAEYRSIHIVGGDLYVTGKFSMETFMTYGGGLAQWVDFESYPNPLTIVYDTVFTMAYALNEYYIGGDFHLQQSSSVNAIARIDDWTTSNPTVLNAGNSKLIAYPNPNNGEKIKFLNAEGLQWLKVYNLQGKLINTFSESQLPDFELPEKGVYIIESNRGEHLRLVRN